PGSFDVTFGDTIDAASRIAAASPNSAPTAREAMDLRYHVERGGRRRCRSEQGTPFGPQHAGPHRMIEKRLHRRPEALDVEEDDRLGVIAEGGAGPPLPTVLPRAEAAGRDHERVGERVHHRFSLMHRFDDVQ